MYVDLAARKFCLHKRLRPTTARAWPRPGVSQDFGPRTPLALDYPSFEQRRRTRPCAVGAVDLLAGAERRQTPAERLTPVNDWPVLIVSSTSNRFVSDRTPYLGSNRVFHPRTAPLNLLNRFERTVGAQLLHRDHQFPYVEGRTRPQPFRTNLVQPP